MVSGRGGPRPRRGRALRRRRRPGARAHQRRVREHEPDRPADRRARAPRRVRRRAGADPRLPRSRGHARVLRQRLRQPGPAPGRVDPRPRHKARSRPRTGIRASTSPSSSIWSAPASSISTSSGRRPSRPAWRCSARHSQRFGVRFDVWFSERSLHEGDPTPVDRELAELARARRVLPPRGGAVAAHHRARRRQGPRARALERRSHLPGLGRRLPSGQAGPRVRAARSTSGAPTITATSPA